MVGYLTGRSINQSISRSVGQLFSWSFGWFVETVWPSTVEKVLAVYILHCQVFTPTNLVYCNKNYDKLELM